MVSCPATATVSAALFRSIRSVLPISSCCQTSPVCTNATSTLSLCSGPTTSTESSKQCLYPPSQVLTRELGGFFEASTSMSREHYSTAHDRHLFQSLSCEKTTTIYSMAFCLVEKTASKSRCGESVPISMHTLVFPFVTAPTETLQQVVFPCDSRCSVQRNPANPDVLCAHLEGIKKQSECGILHTMPRLMPSTDGNQFGVRYTQ